MSVNVQYYGKCNVCAEILSSVINDELIEKAQIRAFQLESGIVFYTSHIMNCLEMDLVNAQMVAESLLSHWDEDETGMGLGSYVNQGLANSGFVGENWEME
ncbi:hypothetical protein KAR91_56955 [Candidatus Pacearchaeota archaeon]|nr:hypothetical protein [Candidatus Pacearchaeota archaeon]